MKILFLLLFFIFKILQVIGIDTFLKGLERSFDEVENKIVDFYVTMPDEQIDELIKISQISLNQVENGGARTLPDFKYYNTTIIVKYDSEIKIFNNCSFKTGGQYARSNDKIGFNIKLDKKLLGRKNIRLRPDASDRSHMRSKLCCDITNRLGVPSVQAVYARLYMNNEYWGLYILMDALKPSWVKQTFSPSEKEITTLIQCKDGGMNFKPDSASKCVNANDEYTDITEFKKFVANVNAAETIEDLEEYMDVDGFLKYIVFEWLIGSYDHFLIYGHNFYFYKRETDGKWLLIEHDFDNTFGTGINLFLWSFKGPNQDGSSNTNNNNNNPYNNNNNPWGGWGWGWGWGGNFRGNEPIKYSFADWEMNIPILQILVYNNQTNFQRIVHEVLVSVFNPATLDPHIDSLKEFLTPYVEEDSIIGEDGRLPGRINKVGVQQSSSLSEFEDNIENSLKYWIKTKFEIACNNYGFNQTEILREAASYVPKPFDYSYDPEKEKEKEKAEEERKKKEAKKKMKNKRLRRD